MSGPLLDVRDLRVTFDSDGGPLEVVRGASFAVAPRETFGIVGESGSGKSIAMLALAGLLPRGARVTGGTAWMDGEDLLAATPARLRALRGDALAFAFQDPMTALNPVMRIGAQIAEPLIHRRGRSRADARARAVALLDMVGIAGAARRVDDYPHQMSGGMRQRAMIAMALACDSRLLIADEPTTALDVTIQAQVVELVRDLAAETGMAVIWITHDVALLSGVVSRLAVVYAGRVVETGPVDALFAAPAHPYTRGLLASAPHLDAVPRARLSPVPGTPPDPARMPPGCPFAPRCPDRIPPCAAAEPPLLDLGRGRAAACIRAPETADA